MSKRKKTGSPNPFEFDRQFYKPQCKLLCGIDEAGRGPLAGPVVAAAVTFEINVNIPGIYDSKKLSPYQREQLFPEITEKAVALGVGIVEPGTIDRINILSATHLAARKALANLESPPDLILTDFLKLKNTPAPVKSFVKGDQKSQVIAAASIIAKVTRDRIMLEYHSRFPLYNFAQNKGYPTKQHKSALAKHGPCEIHRLTFNGVVKTSFL